MCKYNCSAVSLCIQRFHVVYDFLLDEDLAHGQASCSAPVLPPEFCHHFSPHHGSLFCLFPMADGTDHPKFTVFTHRSVFSPTSRDRSQGVYRVTLPHKIRGELVAACLAPVLRSEVSPFCLPLPVVWPSLCIRLISACLPL